MTVVSMEKIRNTNLTAEPFSRTLQVVNGGPFRECRPLASLPSGAVRLVGVLQGHTQAKIAGPLLVFPSLVVIL